MDRLPGLLRLHHEHADLPHALRAAGHRAARGRVRVPQVLSGSLRQAQLFGAVFAASSLITPFFLGAAAGAIASGRVPAEGRGDVWGSWLTATSFFGGAIAVGTCAFLAGVFLVVADAARAGARTWSRSCAPGPSRRRGHRLVVFAALVPLHEDAPTLWAGLSGRALPLVLLSAAAGAATLWLLWVGRHSVARLTALVAVAAVVSGWGIGQYPWLLVDEVTLTDAAGAPATLAALLVAVASPAPSSCPPWRTSSR